MKQAGFVFVFTMIASLSFAAVRLPAVIGSHMVLQQNSRVKLWGWSDPEEKIKVKVDWDTTSYNTTGNANAKWSLEIKTPAAGGPYKITISGYNMVVLEDVMIGEVWLCSGQSNMEMSYNWGVKQYTEDMTNAKNDKIRFFHVPRTTSEYPQDDVKARWVVCNPEDAKSFSLVGYYFGNKIQQELDAPVGLINASWGGTPAEAWTPEEAVDEKAELKEAAAKLKPSNGWPVTTGYTYNGMLYPITNYTIAGALWYQGESNVGTANTYAPLLTTMIGLWRKAWKNDFPFYYVQIAPYKGYGESIPSAILREQQTKVLSYPKTGMIVIHDLVDDISDIHPKMKKDVGLRLANYALAETYNKPVVYKSPMYKSMKVEKDKIRIYFDNADKGLMIKGATLTDFYIAGADKVFVPANAKIDGSTVIVSNKTIKNPVAVRFGFTNAAMPNLYSKEGLPVSIFRTDDWDVNTTR